MKCHFRNVPLEHLDLWVRAFSSTAPFTNFNFCYSSFSARNEFIRTIRNTIRESVRRMAIPGQNKPGILGKPSISSSKRPDNLPGSTPWSLGKKKGKQLKAEMTRHSMDIEDRFTESHLPGPNPATDFRTRSRTFSDLNNMDYNQEQDPYMSGSQSTLASDRGIAKLLHSSNNPTNYSSTTTIHKDSLGSPIWKPRVQNTKSSPHAQHTTPTTHHHPQQQYQQSHSHPSYVPHLSTHQHPHSPYSTQSMDGGREERAAFESSVFSGSAYSDYSSAVYDDRSSTVLLTPPNSVYPTRDDHDTEC